MSTADRKIPYDEQIAGGFISAPGDAGGGLTRFLGFEITAAVAAQGTCTIRDPR